MNTAMTNDNQYEPPSEQEDGLDRGTAAYEASDPDDARRVCPNCGYQEEEAGGTYCCACGTNLDTGEPTEESDEEGDDAENLDLRLLAHVIDFDVELTGQDDMRSIQVDALAGCTVEEARWIESL